MITTSLATTTAKALPQCSNDVSVRFLLSRACRGREVVSRSHSAEQREEGRVASARSGLQDLSSQDRQDGSPCPTAADREGAAFPALPLHHPRPRARSLVI